MPESSVKIGYLILAHNNSEQVGRMIRILKRGNSRVVLHLDKSVKDRERSDFLTRVNAEGDFEEAEPVCCRWGEWSLVEATLSGLEQFRNSGDPVSHVVLLSGSHFPIRSPGELENFLTLHSDTDFIETSDARNSHWVKGGPNIERFQYFYPFNFLTRRRSFEILFSLQQKLGLKRTPPEGLHPHLGSQWWCLRYSTCLKILDFLKDHPSVIRYFRTTWIPDESFFQTLAANLVDSEELTHVPFVHYALTPRGRPYVFHNDYKDYLTGPRHHFFARKISPQAEVLLKSLEDRASNSGGTEEIETTPSSLVAENAKLDGRVEACYKFVEPLPGHLHDNYRELFLAIEHPVFVIIGDSLTESRVKQIGDSLSFMPDLHFLGRPFRKDAVELEGVMEELGLGEKSFEIRDRHTCQLFYEFFSRRKCAVAFVVDPTLDFESWVSFSNLQNYFPICLVDNTDLDGPRYKQMSYSDHVLNWPWGARAQVMTDMEVATYLRFLCGNGSLADACPGNKYLDKVFSPTEKTGILHSQSQKQKFVILSYARSGSYFLVDLLNQIEGVCCYGEIFKKEKIELDEDFKSALSMTVEQRDQKELEYLSRIIELSDADTVGFKLLASQSKDVENHVVGSSEFVKIILKRNIIDVYISLQRAKATGIWIDKGFREPPENPSFYFDAEIFEQECKWHDNYYRGPEEHAKERPDQFLIIDYEQVVDRTVFDSICPILGVSRPSSEVLVSKLKKQTVEAIENLVINLEEMMAYIHDNHPDLYPILKSRVEMESGSPRL